MALPWLPLLALSRSLARSLLALTCPPSPLSSSLPVGRADGSRLPTLLPYPACIDACRENGECVAVTYEGDNHINACVLLATITQATSPLPVRPCPILSL